jgi:hypothetical protein
MPSSGTTAIATTTADPTLALAADTTKTIHWLTIINTGANPGFFSFEAGSDGNPEYHYLPGGSSRTLDLRHRPRTSPQVNILRIGANDLSGVYVGTW